MSPLTHQAAAREGGYDVQEESELTSPPPLNYPPILVGLLRGMDDGGGGRVVCSPLSRTPHGPHRTAKAGSERKLGSRYDDVAHAGIYFR